MTKVNSVESRRLRHVVLILLYLLAMPAALQAEEAPPAAEFRAPEASDEPLRTVTIAIYLLVALTMGTVSLMLVLMLWGSRVRREARKPLPATKPNDPLWYLKTKKKAPGEPPGQPNVSEGKALPDTKTDQPPST